MDRSAIDLTELGSERLFLSGAFQPGELFFPSDEVRQLDLLRWSGWVERKGSEVRFAGQFQTAVELTCVRCLSAVRREVRRAFDLFFELEGDFKYEENAEIELTESETQIAFVVGSELRPGEIMREQVLLALPMKPLCSEECRGLCSICGQDLNARTCDCSVRSGHPAFEVLETLKRRLEEQNS